MREAGYEFEVVNAGSSGDTTTGGLRRLPALLRAHKKIDIFILKLGINDAFRGVPIGQVRSNLQAIIDQVRARHPNVAIVVAGMQLPDYSSNDYVGAFSTIFAPLAEKNRFLRRFCVSARKLSHAKRRGSSMAEIRLGACSVALAVVALAGCKRTSSPSATQQQQQQATAADEREVYCLVLQARLLTIRFLLSPAMPALDDNRDLTSEVLALLKADDNLSKTRLPDLYAETLALIDASNVPQRNRSAFAFSLKREKNQIATQRSARRSSRARRNMLSTKGRMTIRHSVKT